MKKRIAIPYSLLLIATAVAVFFMFRTTSLESQVEKAKKELDTVQNKVSDYEELLQIDSVLVAGNLDGALASYVQSLEIDENNKSVQLRIAIAKKIKALKSNIGNSNSLNANVDSITIANVASPKEINSYDSLNFILEKKQIQLNGLRRQLEQKSFGEYLSFKSKKDNQMHYVGQVKNGMANGTGIALLDTGSRYEGQWRDNHRHGEGKFYWPDGEHYIGSYSHDIRSGTGTYYWPNGEKYVGQWEGDKRNGTGTFYGSDGKVITKGIWQNDILKERQD